MLRTSVVKIPEIVSPVPTPKFGDFRGFFPKYPQNLGVPRPQRIPNYFQTCNPVPIPEIWGFSGMNLNKSPKFGLSPSPKHPQNSGFFGDKPQLIPKKLKLQIMYQCPSGTLKGVKYWGASDLFSAAPSFDLEILRVLNASR